MKDLIISTEYKLSAAYSLFHYLPWKAGTVYYVTLISFFTSFITQKEHENNQFHALELMLEQNDGHPSIFK